MAFIFIEQGGRTPSKSNYKRTLQIKSNLIRITQDQIGLTGRPSAVPILAANKYSLEKLCRRFGKRELLKLKALFE